MKLLVTGGLSLIGSNFILDLIQNYNDFKVTNVDSSKIRMNINWSQKVSFDDGLKNTIQWYQ